MTRNIVSTPIELLAEIRDEIYGGSWQKMLSDLRARLLKRPYNHRLVVQIEKDIKAIEKNFVKTQSLV